MLPEDIFFNLRRAYRTAQAAGTHVYALTLPQAQPEVELQRQKLNQLIHAFNDERYDGADLKVDGCTGRMSQLAMQSDGRVGVGIAERLVRLINANQAR